jgi:hypothetical protein
LAGDEPGTVCAEPEPAVGSSCWTSWNMRRGDRQPMASHGLMRQEKLLLMGLLPLPTGTDLPLVEAPACPCCASWHGAWRFSSCRYACGGASGEQECGADGQGERLWHTHDAAAWCSCWSHCLGQAVRCEATPQSAPHPTCRCRRASVSPPRSGCCAPSWPGAAPKGATLRPTRSHLKVGMLRLAWPFNTLACTQYIAHVQACTPNALCATLFVQCLRAHVELSQCRRMLQGTCSSRRLALPAGQSPPELLLGSRIEA